jgi:hypothetical protein
VFAKRDFNQFLTEIKIRTLCKHSILILILILISPPLSLGVMGDTGIESMDSHHRKVMDSNLMTNSTMDMMPNMTAEADAMGLISPYTSGTRLSSAGRSSNDNFLSLSLSLSLSLCPSRSVSLSLYLSLSLSLLLLLFSSAGRS